MCGRPLHLYGRMFVCVWLVCALVNEWRRKFGQTEWLIMCLRVCVFIKKRGHNRMSEWMTDSLAHVVYVCLHVFVLSECVCVCVLVCLCKAGQSCGSWAAAVWDSIRFLSTLEHSVLLLLLLLSHEMWMAGLFGVWWSWTVDWRKWVIRSQERDRWLEARGKRLSIWSRERQEDKPKKEQR